MYVTSIVKSVNKLHIFMVKLINIFERRCKKDVIMHGELASGNPILVNQVFCTQTSVTVGGLATDTLPHGVNRICLIKKCHS